MINLYNQDCMIALKNMKDNQYDLAIVDPPYGGAGNENINGGKRFGGWFDKYKVSRTGGGWSNKLDKNKKILDWDIAPDKQYFDELFRISKEQIIWGGNYFGLPPNRHFLIWRKLSISENFSMAMCEYACVNYLRSGWRFRAFRQYETPLLSLNQSVLVKNFAS